MCGSLSVLNLLHRSLHLLAIMCGFRGGIRVPDPSPGKSQVIWVSLEISTWTPPPMEKVGPPPLENVGPSETLENYTLLWKENYTLLWNNHQAPSVKLQNRLRTKQKKIKKNQNVRAVFWQSGLDPLAKIHGFAHAVTCNRPYLLIAWCYVPLNR